MRHSRLHTIFIRNAVLLAAAALCAAGGCWEEIEYTGPDPSAVAHRQPSPSATDALPAEAAETTDSTASESAEQQPSSSNDPAPEPPGNEDAPTLPFDIAEAPEDSAAPQDMIVNKTPVDDAESEVSPPVDLEIERAVAPAEPAAPAPALTTRRAAWQLGSKLTLAALANDRRLVPENVAQWFNEARSAAQALGTSVEDLPEAATEGETASRRVHDYLFQQGQRIWHDLTDRHGRDHAALFEMAVKSNVLLVLYEPESAAVQPISAAIAEAGPQAHLPAPLWRPLLDTLAGKPSAAEVRAAVRRLHADIDQYLAESAEQ